MKLGGPVKKGMVAGKEERFMICETEWRIASDWVSKVKAALLMKAWSWF